MFLLKRLLFKAIIPEIYGGLSTRNKTSDAVYLPAFDRVFLLLKAFYLNGLKGDIMEFGVFHGYSAKLLAECMKRFKIRSNLHLFDSFEGLPEIDANDRRNYECANGFWDKGSMRVPEGMDQVIQTKLRGILKDRVFVVKGYFENTLEDHIREKNINKVALIHLDCDLYSSSKYVLRTLFEYELIQDGSILICDDWMTSFGNPNLGQRKAVKEILEEHPHWEFEPYFNYGIGAQVFVIHDLSVSSGKKLVGSESCFTTS